MGHYAAEMQCNTCGRMHCNCVSKPDPDKWIVDDDFMPILTSDFDKKYSTPIMKRLYRKKFDTREEAYQHGTQLIRHGINDATRRMENLQRTLENR